MAALIMIVIFIAFISLGIPDSLLGAAWPAIYADMALPTSYGSFISMTVTCGTVISSFSSGYIIKKLGASGVTVLSTAITATALLGFSFSNSMLWFCLLALPLGLGAGAIDTALNHYVALHFNASSMNFLHCFYGIGVSISPFLMSLTLSDGNNWRGGYRVMALVQAGITLIMILSLPLFRKAAQNRKDAAEAKAERHFSLIDAIKIPAARTCFLVFIAANALEALCNVWAGTFLVSAKGLTAGHAAGLITFYYVGLACGRFLSGILAKRISGMKIIQITQIFTCAALILLILPLPVQMIYFGLFLVGLGIGPLHPNMLQLTPVHFGRDISQTMMGYEIGFSYASILVTPLIFGSFANITGFGIFPYAMLLLFALLILSLSLMGISLKAFHNNKDTAIQ